VVEAEERHRAEMARLREGHATEARVLQKEMAGLRENLARLLEKQQAEHRLTEAEEAGTRKGRSFEEVVHAELEELAQAQDDAAHHVGDTSSEAGGKMGDTVVEIGAGTGPAIATIVFEAKNRKLSKNDAWAELNGAMRERDASYAVLVVAGEDKIPSGLRELTEYQGNKMIAVVDRENPDPLALRLIYRYVRARVLAASDDRFAVDAAGVRAATEEAQSRLKTVNRVRKSLTSITASAEKAREDMDDMVGEVEKCLTRVEALIEIADS
jgi:flagellar hook-basal body complex protein FliE